MRTKEELQKLLISLKGWYKEEFGSEYSAEFIRDPLLLLVKKRLEEFVRKRIDHLPGKDLVNFVLVVQEDENTPVYVAPPEIKKNAPTKKSQKTS